MPRPLRGYLIAALVGTLHGCDSTTEPAPVPALLELTPGIVTLHQGDTLRLEATVRDGNGNTIAGAPLTFVSSKPDVVGVNQTGLLTANGGGAATVLALSGALRDSTEVEVFGHPTSVLMSLPRGGSPHRLAISPAGVTFVTLPHASETARIDLPTLQFSGTVPLGPVPTDVTFNAAGTRAYVSSQTARAVYVIDVAANVVIDSILTQGDPAPVRVTPDGGKLYVATNANSLFVIALPSKSVLKTFALPATSHWMAWHPNSRLLYLSTRDGGTVLEIDTTNDAVLRTLTLGGRTQGMAVSHDGAELYVADEMGGLEIWSLQTGGRLTEIAVGGGAFGVALSPDEAFIYVTVPSTGQLLVIDRATRAVAQTFAPGGTPRGVAFDHYGRHALVANEGGWVTVFR